MMLQQHDTQTTAITGSTVPQAAFVVYSTDANEALDAGWQQLLNDAQLEGKALRTWEKRGVSVQGAACGYTSFTPAAATKARLGLLKLMGDQFDPELVECVPFVTRRGNQGVIAVLRTPQPIAAPAVPSEAITTAHWGFAFEQAGKAPMVSYA